MKARSVARELALFTLFQLEKKEDSLSPDKSSFQDLVLNTIRSLTLLAKEQIKTMAGEVNDLKDYIVDYELRHPANENIPLELPTVPVPIPTTEEMVNKLNSFLQAVENLQEALYMPELALLSQREDVLNYCWMLIKQVNANTSEIDQRLNEAAKEWRVERFQKMDLLLLRLALAELLYTGHHVDAATVVNEILELARQFTTEESRKFIHGILGNIAEHPAGVAQDV